MRLTNHSASRLWPWAATTALVIGNLFLHKSISDVCDALFARIGRGPYERTMLLTIAALSVGGALLLLRGHARALRGPRLPAVLLALAACTVAVQRWLLVSNVELIHLPQFGLLAALLLRGGLGAQAAWLGATLAGVLDETYQYLVIYAHVPGNYLDYNDMVLNALGAGWAVALAAAGGARDATRGAHRWPPVVPAALCAALGVALWLAPPRGVAMAAFPYWRPALARAATGLEYHVMTASEGLAAALGIWGLVVLAMGGERRQRAARPTKAAAAVLLVTLAPGSSVTARTPFIITFWCGPPLAEFTDARAAEIAAAGFNVVGAPCEGAISPTLNRRALDVAARHGLALWITDPRLEQYHDIDANWEARLAEAIAEYDDHPALGGYFLVDEPSAAKFADLAKVVARLQAVDPQRVPYINLLPDFASPDALGTDTYREHLEQYMAVVHPPLLSFDYYPFKTDGDRATFFDNLSLVRAVAQDHGVPFLLVVQAMPHGPYRDPTESEIAWQVHHALAFGARGISYFAYWTPVHVADGERWQFRHGLVEDGRPTEHLRQAARLNRDARAYADELAGLRSFAVADSAGRFGTALPIGPLAGIDGGPVSAGFFAGDGTLTVMLVNQDYRNGQQIALRLRPGTPPPDQFDAGRGWRRLHTASLALAPGGAALLRWR